MLEKKNLYHIWFTLLQISIDEATDSEGRHIAAIVVRSLEDETKRPYLMDAVPLEATNSKTITEAVDDCLRAMGPECNRHDVLMLVTDAASYMRKAGYILYFLNSKFRLPVFINVISCLGRMLKDLYPNMLHITCLAHALHNVCEAIRHEFDNVNDLIAKTKQVFSKCPSRINLFRQIAPGIPLPPSPVITRWGTWIEAVHYYCQYLDNIIQVCYFPAIILIR